MKTGGRAFPGIKKTEKTRLGDFDCTEQGMTLRDYFAAKAMQAMISNSTMIDNDSDSALNYASLSAYKFADAMLKARE